jgi:hypothetical protein
MYYVKEPLFVEGTGFEPVDPFSEINSLANCRIRPLCQPSFVDQPGFEPETY